MVVLLSLALQVVLVAEVGRVGPSGQGVADPVRFGVPLPAAVLADGLRVRGPGDLQWRRLPIGDGLGESVWVEIALAGTPRTTRVVRGGRGPAASGAGPVFVRSERERDGQHGRERITTWRWCNGRRDERVRVEFARQTLLDGELFEAGEARTRWRRTDAADPAAVTARGQPLASWQRAAGTAMSSRFWQQCGLLPAGGRVSRSVRRRLVAAQRRLVELPGERGAGDFARSGGVITNGEFDTALGLVQLALATADSDAFARAVRCAHHLRDHDLDARTGLPFPHGPGHRTGTPQPGHTWLHGLLLVGLLTADDDLILTARSIGRALAARPPMGEGPNERARDYAWPLLELEALLVFDDDPLLRAAADRMARAIDARFVPAHRTYCFGEGHKSDGTYFERAWITGGLVVPALRRHLQRQPNRSMAENLARVEQRLLDRVRLSRPGLPTHWRCAGGRVFAERRAEGDVRGLFLLEGLPAADLRRVMRSEELRDCLSEVPAFDDPDLATTFSMLARCFWVYR